MLMKLQALITEGTGCVITSLPQRCLHEGATLDSLITEGLHPPPEPPGSQLARPDAPALTNTFPLSLPSLDFIGVKISRRPSERSRARLSAARCVAGFISCEATSFYSEPKINREAFLWREPLNKMPSKLDLQGCK